MTFRDFQMIVLGIGVGIALGLVAFVANPCPSEPEPTVMMQAKVINVLERTNLSGPETLLEYEDGTRRRIDGYYGEPGDSFMVERRP